MSKPTPLEKWLHRIADQEMPIFGQTVQRIVSVAEDDDAPIAELAKVILQDATMTTRVLKLANSTFYNPQEQGISTVSRAVVVLGFNTVRSMCLSIALVDAFVESGASRERLTRELARSIHAAVQARAVAIERGDASPEEVFIATLLYRLGHLAFWCFSGEKGDELDALLERPGYTPEEAEEELLGFRLNQLTAGLAREWRINDLLSNTLSHPEAAGKRGQTVALSYQLARAAEKGWESLAVVQLGKQLAELAGQEEKAFKPVLHNNARESARIAGAFGASAAAQTIPLPSDLAGEVEAAEAPQPEYPQPDGMLQLKILRELGTLLDAKADLNLVLELVLEGIYRGVGMDRTLFALLTPDRQGLRAKLALGPGREVLTHDFYFHRRAEQENILFHVLDGEKALWVDRQRDPKLARYLPPVVENVLGRTPFFIAPILIRQKSIGLFYCDRSLSGHELDDEAFESFRHFAQQANMGLSMLAMRPQGGGR